MRDPKKPQQVDPFKEFADVVAECEAKGMTRRAIASSMGMQQPILNQILAKAYRPGAVARKKIADATKGRIPETAWLEQSDHDAIAAVRPLPIDSPRKSRLASVVPAPPKSAA